MAGVVAMASIIEDFDSQPCKKARKDGGSPVVKTITNYFSPVSKPVEKPFSPPRSNNIMDYFSRKALSSKEKTSSPEQSKENCQTSQPAEKHTSAEAAATQPRHKRTRKTSKAARKLVEPSKPTSKDEESCVVIEDSRDKKRDSAMDAARNCGDIATVPEKPDKNPPVTEKDDQAEDGSKCKTTVSLNPELCRSELSPIVPSKSKAQPVKTAAKNPRKKQQHKIITLDPEENEAESSLNDVSMEVNVDEASQLNNSTVTISFEDFVKSQSEDSVNEQGGEDEREVVEGAEETNTDCKPEAKENVDNGELSLQASPEILTVQAEVHVSPQQKAKVGGKMASIFTRRTAPTSPPPASSPNLETGHQSPTSVAAKRKSNVVLQEEDLELTVLESESMPKCSEAERKQFMAAFKQPSLDGSKAKPAKSQGKQKQQGEKVSDETDMVDKEDADVPASVEEVPATSSQVKKVGRKKAARKNKNAAKEEKAELTPTTAAPAVEETAATAIATGDKQEEPALTSTPSVPAVRRSRRVEAVAREATTVTSTPKTRKSDAEAASPNNSPAKTPKSRKSRHGVFVAELVCPPDTQQSPIRIKFRRVHKDVSTSKAEGESDKEKSFCAKTSNESKKQKKAKKLVEKAREIQKSKKGKKAGSKDNVALRRSSRAEASTKKSYCEDEDSVICLEEDQSNDPQKAPEKSKTQKSLRSLNDVLGKAVSKDTKAASGSKAASLGSEKAARRPSAVISIFDDSSREGSENSQDDEQFRARREFLKSGLPESFRKQIARTAATKEAYSLSCSSLQPVLHTRQPPADCPLWSLLWPETSLLSHLKEFCGRASDTLPSVGGSLPVTTKPTRRAFCERGSGWKPEMPEKVRQLLMEEVSTSNPLFPVQMFSTRFLKRQADQQLQSTSSEAVSKVRNAPEPVGGKRKRGDDEGDVTMKVAKKQRASSSEENVSTAGPEPAKREGRTRRARAKPSAKAASNPSEGVILVDDLPVGEDTGKDVKEEVLWTEKYQPQHSSDIIGNTGSVRRLHSWLKEWKLRADREERKNQKDKKHEEGSIDSDWDGAEEDGDDLLCNTVLITGPTGVGKTAAVYACAQELGFKVFEVNASSQRSGRLILSQLKEATQSHQVDSQGVNAHKPTYFNSYGTSSSSSSTLRPGSSPRKINSPRRVVSSPRKHPQSPRAAKRGGLAPTSLANFFKMGQPANKEATASKKTEQSAPSKKAPKANESSSKQKDPVVVSPATTKEKSSDEQSKKTATSLILFEEVDVIFDDDSGFLAAIKTFMTTTKRPVILTTSDPTFSAMFDGNFEEIHFKTPSVVDVSSFLQVLCLAEDLRTDQRDIGSLLRINGCDIRQSLLQLQFWARSGGGRSFTRPLTHDGKTAEEELSSSFPPCDSGCSDSMLGLLNLEPKRNIWELLKSPCPAEDTLRWELLTDSRRRGVDLLYSNMETLLPLPVTQLTASTFKSQQTVSDSLLNPVQNPEETPSTCPPSPAKLPLTADSSEDASPVKMSHRMRKTKRRHRLPDQDGDESDSDSEDSFLSLRKSQETAQVKEENGEAVVKETVKRKALTPEEKLKSLPVSQCLGSIAGFLDDMSYVDSSLLPPADAGSGPRRPAPVGAVVKDGMTDESRVELDGSRTAGELVLEIPAVVEALSFHRCLASVTEAWDASRRLEGETLGEEAAAELSLPVAAHRAGYSFIQDGLRQPQVVRRRREVMESLMFRGTFGTLGSRSAAALDYLPALRTICRSEQLKEQGKVKRRFLHYLDAIHLSLEKSMLQDLAEDFP